MQNSTQTPGSRLVSKFLVFTSLLAFARGFSVPPVERRSLVLHERRDTIPNGFILSEPAPNETKLDLRIALVQNDPAGLEKTVYEVSTPGSPNYGKHLTKEQVEKYIRPSNETVEAVTSWLSSKGIIYKPLSAAGDWLGFSLAVEQANEHFGANFSVFTHLSTREQSIRTLDYSIPLDLKQHISLVHPTVSFSKPSPDSIVSFAPRSKGPAKRQFTTGPCNQSITPSCLQDLYAIPATPATESSNTLAVLAFQGNYPSRLKLQTFLRHLRPDLNPNNTWVDRYIVGAAPTPVESLESDLDVQYTVGLASNVPNVFIAAGLSNVTATDFPQALLDTFNLLLNDTTPPQTISVSYGSDESTVGPAMANAVCNAIMQLGARGSSILFSSGDGGVGGSSFDGDSDESGNCTTFLPTFPSGCPFVTSVGGTKYMSPEVASHISSGGMSNIFPIPQYQASAVPEYIKTLGDTYKGLYNTTGRGFPDVAAAAENYNIIGRGNGYQFEFGTSASAPTFASVIALVNDRLIAAGKSPMGFLNPFLYSDAGRASLNDITSGNNPGCSTDGFPAVAGWDPVTGLGTPNFTSILAAAMAA